MEHVPAAVSRPSRQVWYLLMVSSLAAANACHSAPIPPPELPFYASTVERHPDGSIQKGLLATPTTIAGVPCKGWVRLQPDGRLISCELAADTTIQGHHLPAASYVWFADDGQLQSCFLARNAELGGQMCRGGPFKIATSFHPNGNLHAFFPRDEIRLGGVVCAASTQAPVYLHPDGQLAGCRLAADAVVDGHQLRSGDTIELDAAGRLLQPGR